MPKTNTEVIRSIFKKSLVNKLENLPRDLPKSEINLSKEYTEQVLKPAKSEENLTLNRKSNHRKIVCHESMLICPKETESRIKNFESCPSLEISRKIIKPLPDNEDFDDLKSQWEIFLSNHHSERIYRKVNLPKNFKEKKDNIFFKEENDKKNIKSSHLNINAEIKENSSPTPPPIPKRDKNPSKSKDISKVSEKKENLKGNFLKIFKPPLI